IFLPPYSPDLNPIEEAFAKLKAYLRWHGARMHVAMGKKDGKQHVHALIMEGLHSISTGDAAGWFHDSGY
ncbi:hypothetical protein BS47DRAFT_1277851, partial [Hydnum rufescens UP504]